MGCTIISYPLETMYFSEVINDLLKTYNTVSIQKCENCYLLKLEGEVEPTERNGEK
jgi:hypothetical protein